MTEVLQNEEIGRELANVNLAWSAIPGQGLVRVFETGTFAQSMSLANKIASIAEAQDHHPELRITYDELEITSFTHSAGGVTQQDFELAKSIDKET